MTTLVAAIAKNGVIGAGNALPWRLPADLRFFKKVTMGHTLIMGRKTYESIGRPLPGRTTVVVTRSFTAPGVIVAADITTALDRPGELFVVGGAEMYRAAFPYCDRLYLTRIDADIAGDTYFPDWDPALFHLDSVEPHAADSEAPFAWELQTWTRVTQSATAGPSAVTTDSSGGSP